MRTRNSFGAALLATATLAFSAQTSATKIACATCHAAQSHWQPETSMANALHLLAEDPILKAHPKLTFQKGGYSYTIERRGDESSYSVTNGTDTISLPISWTFGAHSQTYVLEREGRYYESLVSYYSDTDSLDITTGDQALHPQTVLQAMGRELSTGELQSCLGCHSTGAVVEHELHLDSLNPGVRCARCHAGAHDHLQAVSHGKLDSVPPKLERLSPEDLANFCGQCHRSWETVVTGRLFGVVNVRFQPYRLANSKCFDGSDQRISCIACHDPHREVVREENVYDAKCLACHSAGAKLSLGMTSAHPEAAAMKTCPVSRTGCVGCHMPKVPLPGGHMIFTDHDIRIVRSNDRYPN